MNTLGLIRLKQAELCPYTHPEAAYLWIRMLKSSTHPTPEELSVMASLVQTNSGILPSGLGHLVQTEESPDGLDQAYYGIIYLNDLRKECTYFKYIYDINHSQLYSEFLDNCQELDYWISNNPDKLDSMYQCLIEALTLSRKLGIYLPLEIRVRPDGTPVFTRLISLSPTSDSVDKQVRDRLGMFDNSVAISNYANSIRYRVNVLVKNPNNWLRVQVINRYLQILQDIGYPLMVQLPEYSKPSNLDLTKAILVGNQLKVEYSSIQSMDIDQLLITLRDLIRVQTYFDITDSLLTEPYFQSKIQQIIQTKNLCREKIKKTGELPKTILGKYLYSHLIQSNNLQPNPAIRDELILASDPIPVLNC